MSDPLVGPDDVLIDRWAAGRLEAEERRAFETRLSEDPALATRARLQGAIDDSLRRSFEVPAFICPPAVAEAKVPIEGASVARAASRFDWWPFVSVAAAVLALLLYAIGEWSRGEEGPGVPDASKVAAEETRGGLRPAPDYDRPSLDTVYFMTGAAGPDGEPQGAAVLCSYEEPEIDDGLTRTLERRHGQRLRLASDVSRCLFGPFLLAEWPSASIFVTYPEELGGRAVVIAIESEENHRCCIRPTDPVREDLRAFVWPVGKVRITEITPDLEPRFLQHFETIQ